VTASYRERKAEAPSAHSVKAGAPGRVFDQDARRSPASSPRAAVIASPRRASAIAASRCRARRPDFGVGPGRSAEGRSVGAR
jgi:hypothetical protein